MSILSENESIQKLLHLSQQATIEAAEFQQRIADNLHIHTTDLKALLILAYESPLAAGQLGERLKITPGAVTGVVGRLEKAGLAKRIIDPMDRRKVSIRLDEKGSQQAEVLYRKIGEDTIDLLATYSKEELQVLISYFEKSLALIKDK